MIDVKLSVYIDFNNFNFKAGKIVGIFYEKELWKTKQKEFRIGKIIKRKGYKICGKSKGYNLFNSWIDKKDIE